MNDTIEGVAMFMSLFLIMIDVGRSESFSGGTQIAIDVFRAPISIAMDVLIDVVFVELFSLIIIFFTLYDLSLLLAMTVTQLSIGPENSDDIDNSQCIDNNSCEMYR